MRKRKRNLEYEKKYYLANKEKYDARRKQWRIDNPLRTKFLQAKADVKAREMEFKLTYEFLIELWNKGCYYCKNNLLKETGISADRINNDIGYLPNNVLPCCGRCNKIRGDNLTVDEMQIAMNAVLSYWIEKGR
jgi:hypothetical protein